MPENAALKKAARLSLKALELAGSRGAVLAVILTLTFAAALLPRLAPMKWGIYLNEFDPYYEYYLATQVLKHGNGNPLGGIAWWYHWWFENPKPRDYLFWYPIGRDLRRTSQPGAAFTSSTLYVTLKALGVNTNLYTVHAFVPPVGAALAVFAAFLLGRKLHSDSAGVLAAAIIGVSWAYMYRTNFGAKHEGIAIPFMLFSMYFFIEAVEEGSAWKSVLSGLLMGVVVLSWGAYLYPWNLIALAALIWLLVHPTDVKAAKAFLIHDLIVTLFIATLPRFGPRIAFLAPVSIIPDTALVVAFMALTGTLSPSLKKRNLQKNLPYVAGALILLFAVLYATGMLARISGRILAVVLPTVRAVAVTTVAEHAIPTWVSLFRDYTSAILFGIFAAYLGFLEYKRDFKSLFLALFFVTALYFASTMARLTLILAPAAAVAAGVGFTQILDSLIELSLWDTKKARRSYSKELVIVGAALLILAFAPSIVASNAPIYSHEPPLILSSSIPVIRYNYEYMDWIATLEWIRQNVPPDAVVAEWWDYGYWVSVNTKRKSTCDNATLDTKQIQKIARAFMSDEETAIRIFREMNVSYVVVFEPLQKLTLQNGINVYFSLLYPAYGGDVAKSAQMARWIGLNPGDYLYGYGTGRYAYIQPPNSNYRFYVLVPANNSKALNATIYRMVYTKNYKQIFFIFERIFGSKVPGYNGPIYELKPLKHFKLVYVSEPNGWVKVFKVEYPEEKP